MENGRDNNRSTPKPSPFLSLYLLNIKNMDHPVKKKPKLNDDDAGKIANVRQELPFAVDVAGKVTELQVDLPLAAASASSFADLQNTNAALKKALAKKDQDFADLKKDYAALQEKTDQQIANLKEENPSAQLLAVLCSDDFPPNKPLQCTGTAYTHVNTENDPAYFTEGEFKVHRVYPVVNTPDFNFRNLTSKLLSEQQNVPPGQQQQYDNESDLRDSINDAVSDTIKICNEMIRVIAQKKGLEVPFYLQKRTETTLFSNIVDHVVIYDYRSNTPIFAVEAKKHLPEIFQENSGHKVLGQCFDQLRELMLMGHFCPFGSLTSHNETIITWLVSEIHTKVLQHHEERGLLDRSFLEDVSEEFRIDNNIGSQSPPKLCKSEEQIQPNRVSPDSQLASSETNTMGRSIVLSAKRFTQEEIVDVFVNAVFCSLDGFYHRPMTTLDLVENAFVTVNDAIGLTEKTYKWQRLSKLYLGPLTRKICSSNEAEKIYLISYLGSGATSKVYRAISESGHGCVVKLYVQCRDEGNKLMKLSEFKKNSKVLATREEMNFKKIYPNLQNYVWKVELNKLQCLIMPFFAPIEKGDRTNTEVLDGIREKLHRFCEQKKKFRERDQLWRHVGCFQKQIFLFDLGDLIDVDQPSAYDQSGGEPSFITEHMAKLARNA